MSILKSIGLLNMVISLISCIVALRYGDGSVFFISISAAIGWALVIKLSK